MAEDGRFVHIARWKTTQDKGVEMIKFYSLYDRLLHRKALHEAFKKVKKANGSPGTDRQSIADFTTAVDENIDQLLHELKSKRYRPDPVLRVEIPKAQGGVRKLGVPSVRDRVVQQALLNILQPIFDPTFHPSSYGYRPGRSAQDALSKATAFMREHGLDEVVDMDLSKCFDTLDHNLILRLFRRKISDGSILNLLEMFLKSGVQTASGFEATDIGSPQGGVISPLVCNVYLNEFDQFMKSRGHRIVRYADDILIFKRSKAGAEHALKVASDYLEGDLRLTVNREKTHLTTLQSGVKYLGVEILGHYTRIQPEKVRVFKQKVKRITRRNSPVNLRKVVCDLNKLLRGYGNYFRVANCKGLFYDLMRWIRRRLRLKQLTLYKKPERLHRRLRQLGYSGEFLKMKMTSWRNSASPQSHYAMPNRWFDEIGLFDLSKIKTGVLPEIR